MYLNKVILVGNLTRDPELKSLPSGIKVVNFGLATNRSYKDKEGDKKEEVEFHNLVSFGKQAEVIEQWCKKGSQLMVEGRLSTKSWESDGKKMYKTEIVVDSFQFGNKAKETSTLSEQDKENIKAIKEQASQNQEEEEIDESSIPF